MNSGHVRDDLVRVRLFNPVVRRGYREPELQDRRNVSATAATTSYLAGGEVI